MSDDKVVKLVFELQRKIGKLEKRVSFLERERLTEFFENKPVEKVVDKVVDN